MKNEQHNNQGKQDQQKNTATQQSSHLNQGNQATPGNTNQNKQNQSSSPEKSNISVDNDGRIGKAHDQWNNGQNNQQDRNQNNNRNNEVRSDKTVTEPEIDAPIYDPERTEKKIPQMEGNKNQKK